MILKICAAMNAVHDPCADNSPLPKGYPSISQEICTWILLCCAFVVVIHWLIFPYPSGLLHCHCGNLTIAPVPAKQPWWILLVTPCSLTRIQEFIHTQHRNTTRGRRPSVVLRCQVWTNSRIRGSKQGVTNLSHAQTVFVTFWDVSTALKSQLSH